MFLEQSLFFIPNWTSVFVYSSCLQIYCCRADPARDSNGPVLMLVGNNGNQLCMLEGYKKNHKFAILIFPLEK